MATIEDFKKWVKRDLHSRDVAEVRMSDEQDQDVFRIRIYTAINRYGIVARECDDGGYLGCIAQARKARAGEDWLRGNDLPDGKLTKKTWRQILAGIVRYELQEIHRTVIDTPTVEKAA